jgi:hypothetical protein
MDAATLYMVLTLPNGEQQTSTVGYSSLQACAAQMDFLRTVQRADRKAPIAAYWCEEHKPHIDLQICESWYSGRCDRYTPSTRRGCEALRWIAHMRDRSLYGRCDQDPPEKEPPPPKAQ